MFAVFFFERIGDWGMLLGPCVFFVLIFLGNKIDKKRMRLKRDVILDKKITHTYLKDVSDEQLILNMSEFFTKSHYRFHELIIQQEELRTIILNERKINVLTSDLSINKTEFTHEYTPVTSKTLEVLNRVGRERISKLPFMTEKREQCYG